MMILRKARMQDVEPIHKLINDWADKGLMLPRSRNMLYEGLREITLAEDEGRIIGAASLHILWEDLAEVRAMAVAPDYGKQGVGKTIIQALLEEARQLGIVKVFALTYQQGFFEKCGFHEITKENLPHKVWKECIDCPKFPNCDEVAMLIHLGPQE
jgi:amino-acid N-acetyltransferase